MENGNGFWRRFLATVSATVSAAGLSVVSVRIWAGGLALALAFSQAALASSVEAVRGVESFALDSGGADGGGYVAEYDAAPQIRTYAEIVYRSYADALAAALRLRRAVADFTAAPSEGTLARARRAWVNARLPYSRTEAFRFYEGPIDAEDGPEGRLNGWPVNEAGIDSVRGDADAGIVNEDGFAITPAALAQRNQAADENDVTLGWHAIEFLLWGQDFNPHGPGARTHADYLPPAANAKRRADYLNAAAEALVADLAGLAADWAADDPDNYRAAFLAMPQREALGRMLTGMAMLSSFEMGLERLAVAMESGEQEDEQSCFSDNTRADFLGNQSGIAALWFGAYGDFRGAGLDALAAFAAPAEARRAGAAVFAASDAVSRLHSPFDAALHPKNKAARKAAKAAVAALREQGRRFQSLGRALGARVILGE